MTTAVIALLLAAGTAATATAARPLTVRLEWLQERVKTHRFGCRHKQIKRSAWHCQALRWSSRELHEARAEWERAWWLWLPAKFQRVGACETGYGRRPGNWRHDSGKYVSAFGIIRPAYDQFARQLGLQTWNGANSPWDQYRIADAIRARYSWSAWGCGGR